MANFYYGGVLLPELPAELLAEYPIVWIYRAATKNIKIVFSKYQWYIKKNIYTTVHKYKEYGIKDGKYYLTNNYSDNGNYSPNVIIWTNTDILKDSLDSTEVYFAATDPVPEFPEEETPAPSDDVLVSRASLESIAAAIREKTGSADTYKPAMMSEAILAIQTGGIGSRFQASASGAVLDLKIAWAKNIGGLVIRHDNRAFKMEE